MKKYLFLAILAFTTPAANACAEHNSDPQAHVKAYEESMEKMHDGMMIKYSDDADADFVRGMIPHHQGAIDMAKIQLQYGKDLKIRKLAKGIIAAQEKEIKQMQEWLKKRETPAKE